MTERIVIEGRDLIVVEQPSLFDKRAQLAEDREAERRRHWTATAPQPAETPEQDLGELIDLLQVHNPFWDAYANEYAELNPDRLHGKALAKLLRKHRIDPTKEAA